MELQSTVFLFARLSMIQNYTFSIDIQNITVKNEYKRTQKAIVRKGKGTRQLGKTKTPRSRRTHVQESFSG